MKVINRTPWRTDHLRAFARKAASEWIDAPDRKRLVVEFVSARTRGVSGYAYYRDVRFRSGPLAKHGWIRYARIRVPAGRISPFRTRFLTKWKPSGDPAMAAMVVADTRAKWVAAATPNKRALAAVISHELLHTVGLRHPGERCPNVMGGHYSEADLGERWAWADAMPLGHSMPTTLPSTTVNAYHSS